MKNKKKEVPVTSGDSINKDSLSKIDYQTTIENHKQAASHHTAAAMHHLEAAKYYEEGNREKAAHSSMIAFGHHAIAGEFLNDDAKHHAQELKQTNYR
jgi:hypothetical protein